MHRLLLGVTLADGTALPAEVEALTPDRLTSGSSRGVPPDQTDVRRVWRGVNALHRDAIGGLALDEPLPGPVAGTFHGGGRNYQRMRAAFHLIFKKHHILKLKYSQEPRKKCFFI